MQDNRTTEEFISELKNQVEQYVKLEVELIKIEATIKVSKIGAYLISSIILIFLIFMCVLFSSLLLGFYLSDIFNSNTLGFGTVAGIYVLLIIGYKLIQNKLIIKPISNKIIKMIYGNE
jgi:hypothetical protein